jgi:hypothetical protein
MALSMLGYRWCSDLQELPATELKHLLAGRPDRVFDAYVNIGDVDWYLPIQKNSTASMADLSKTQR